MLSIDQAGRTIAVALLLLFAPLARGADTWDVYVNQRNGLDLARDGRYVYLATSGGVLRLDVQTSALAPLLPLDGLASVNVTSVAVDGRGTKWFGHGDPDLGISLLDSSGEWSLVSSFEGLLLGAGKHVNTILASGDSVWVGTESGATLFVNRARRIILSQEKEGIASDHINGILTRGAEVWLATSQGLSVYSAGEVRNYTPASDSALPSPEILCLAEDSDGRVWGGTGRGLFRVENGNLRRLEEYALLAGRRIRSIAFEDSSGSDVPWFATDNGRYRNLSRKARRETGSDMGNPEAATKVLVDADGEVWLANSERWMFRWIPTADGWREYTQRGTIPFNHIGDVAVDKRGFVWCPLVGNVEGAANSPGSRMLIYDALTWTNVGREAIPDSYAAVSCVAIDSLGNRWFGIREAGVRPRGTVIKIDQSVGTSVGPEDVEWFPIHTTVFAENARAVFNIDIGPDNKKWVAVTTEGFAGLDSAENPDSWGSWSLDDEDPAPTCLVVEQEGNLATSPIDITVGRDGRVWYALQRDKGGWINYRGTLSQRTDDLCARFTQDNSPLPPNQFTVRVDAQGKVWYGSQTGLGRYDPGTASWRIYTVATSGGGLPDNRVRAIAFDRRGNTWVGTFGGGLAVLLSDGETWLEPWTLESNQRRGTGLTSNDITALFVRPMDAEEDEIWIATWGGGVTRFVKDWTDQPIIEEPTGMVRVSAYPNPYREGDTPDGIGFADVPVGAAVEIYSLTGAAIRTIDGPVDAEAPDPKWDLRNEGKVIVGGGIYLFLVRWNGEVLQSGKIAYLR